MTVTQEDAAELRDLLIEAIKNTEDPKRVWRFLGSFIEQVSIDEDYAVIRYHRDFIEVAKQRARPLGTVKNHGDSDAAVHAVPSSTMSAQNWRPVWDSNRVGVVRGRWQCPIPEAEKGAKG